MTLECGEPKSGIGPCAGGHQSRMAGFVLDTACKSGLIDVAIFTIRTLGKFIVASTNTQTFLVCKTFIDVRMTSQFSDSSPSKPETVVANLRIIWRNSEELTRFLHCRVHF